MEPKRHGTELIIDVIAVPACAGLGAAFVIRLQAEQRDQCRYPRFVKSAVYTTAHVSGLSRALAFRYRGRGIIFALHSIVDDDAFHPDHTLRCPVGKLEWILRRLRATATGFSLAR